MAIRPPREDLYRELGVPRNASTEQVSAAFRERAKILHPDARPGDLAAAEEFKRVSLAYSVLSDPVQRVRYDAGASPVELTLTQVERSAGRRATSPTSPFRFTRRGARWAVGAGVALVVLGLVAAVWVIGLQRSDADLLADGVPARAVVVEAGGERAFEFTTRAGDVVRAAEATKSGTGQPDVGSEVEVRYDRADPTRVVLVESHTARDVTLWIVAVKFLVGGAVLTVLGARRLAKGG